jgi:exopolyphosphatase/guanosine-5'-triphosphate,3'-diphosphate pyrophosphatase
MTADRMGRLRTMRIGIVDVGSNTMRLLVAETAAGGVEPVHQDRSQVGLGAAIEHHGWIPAPKLAEAAECARQFAQQARALRCGDLRVVVTAPGRQSVNADDLVVELQRATGAVPRVLTAEDEGRYAYLGAAATLPGAAATLAVCDVGGGSTEIAVGPSDGSPEWLASVDIGSLRLTSRLLERDAPGKGRVKAARAAVAELFASLEPPESDIALAVGGSARALRRIVEGPLSAKALDEIGDHLAKRSAVKVAAAHGIGDRRAATVLAGAVIRAEAARRVGRPFEVARAGLREGLAAEAIAERRAA